LRLGKADQKIARITDASYRRRAGILPGT